MHHSNTLDVGLDVHKDTIAVWPMLRKRGVLR
jgi:hypothetical protein